MWVKKNEYYLQQDNWTICKAINVPMPYALYEGSESRGYFKTSKEAQQKQLELVKGEK